METAVIQNFLKKYNFFQPDVKKLTESIFVDMEKGLSKKSMLTRIADQPMLIASNKIPEKVENNSATIVIDAGGTNFRSCLVKVDDGGQTSIENMEKTKMPGIDKELSKDEFYDAIASKLDHLKNQSERIGFCFSYAMEMTMDGDGKVLVFSKEVKAPQAIGTYVGAELKKALERRGWTTIKKITLLNDTTASLLAGIAVRDGKTKYSSYIGFILGTGMNNAYIEYNPIEKIDNTGDRPLAKTDNLSTPNNGTAFASSLASQNYTNGDRPLANTGDRPHIVVCECGMFSKLVQSDFDIELDAASANPGASKLEKMCSGAYLGIVEFLLLKKACEEGLFSSTFVKSFSQLQTLTPFEMDEFLKNTNESSEKETVLGKCISTKEDQKVLTYLLLQVYERAARIVASVLSASVLKSGKGTDPENPICIVANGSTFWKAFGLHQKVQELLKTNLSEKNNSQRYYQIVQIENDITLGTLAAAFM